jgi:prevent-host-death family protein
MKIAPLADVKARLSAHIEQVEAEGPVIITRNGRPVAVLLAPRDEEDLRRLVLTHSPRFQAVLEKSRASIRAGQGLARNTFWKAVAAGRRKED